MEIGHIQRINIEQEMQRAYLDYAMSVIVARALPDARDGLKPVQRRLLYAMHELKLWPSASHKKSARIVGEVLGKYHPHGDTAVYEAMARMAQDFSLRFPLVDGQGNFGSVDGDSPAAMRYTEARLAAIAMELLTDIDKDTVDWSNNFDDTLQEPKTLPARLPNLLLNGASGIAVGMATSIPPHNLNELCNTIALLIDRWEEREEISIEELMDNLPGPDFPTGGIIAGEDGIAQAYATGKGRVILRALTTIEPRPGNRHRIVVTELPYQINKSNLLERIASLARDGRLEGISDLRDESDRHGMSIVIELKRGAQPQKILNRLFKHTPLQSTFSIQLLALVNGEPRLLTLKRALELYVEHRQQVIVRRSQYELSQAQARAHILEGLTIALDQLDAIIATIRASANVEAARKRLIKQFKLTQIQAQAILDMQLRRLAALERQKIEDEYAELVRRIADLEELLASPRKILAMIRSDIAELKQTYGNERRTRIAAGVETTLDDKDLVTEEEVLISITQQGYVKRVPAKSYRSRDKGGVLGMATREEDSVLGIFSAFTLDAVLFFTNRGKVFMEQAHQIPAADRAARGVSLSTIFRLSSNEYVTAITPISNFDAAGFLTMVTTNGRTKRTKLSTFAKARRSGLIVFKLAKEDELGWVQRTPGDAELILVTEGGKTLRFKEEQVRPTGRTAAGVFGMRLEKEDRITSAQVVVPEYDLLIVTTQGFGKRVPLAEFQTRNRNTKGILCVGGQVKTRGNVAAARVVCPSDQVTLISAQGMVVRIPVETIPQMGRTTRGEQLMELQEGDQVTSIAVLENESNNK